mgnify:FL=1
MARPSTTTAGVRYLQQLDFEDEFPGVQIWLIEMKFDGPAPGGITEVRFAGNATAAVKRTAVRTIVNREIKGYEPATVALTDAAVQISGQPV